MLKKIIIVALVSFNVCSAHVLTINVLQNEDNKRVILFSDRRAYHEEWVPQSEFFKTFMNVLNSNPHMHHFLLEDPGDQDLKTLNAWFCPAIVNLLLDKKNISKERFTYFPVTLFKNNGLLEQALSLGTMIMKVPQKRVVVYGARKLVDDVVSLLTHKEVKHRFKTIFTTEKIDPDEWQDTIINYVK